MKSARLLNMIVAGMVLITLASGCKKGPKNITAIPANGGRIGDGSLNPPISPGRNVPVDDGAGGRNLNGELPTPFGGARDEAALAAQTIYFDFDSSSIQPAQQGKLDAVATYLKSTAGVQVLVEGHCDERGTEEYNRSLGERRAISAREYLLQKHGISSERVTTTTLGAQKPVALERTEEAYARNRRGEFIVLRP